MRQAEAIAICSRGVSNGSTGCKRLLITLGGWAITLSSTAMAQPVPPLSLPLTFELSRVAAPVPAKPPPERISARRNPPLVLAFELPDGVQANPDRPLIPAQGLDETVAQRDRFLDSNSHPPQLDPLFQGGSRSLVARVVGSAEGTLTPAGDRTRAYYGHRDPGNGVWNRGLFSYQHGAKSPQEADRKQLRRLRRQTEVIYQKAARLGLKLSLFETLNAIDLANQSPRAALSRGGYVDRLAQTREAGLEGDEAILWDRTRSFLDPDTHRWTAPGLGNTEPRITRDQARRMRAIARAVHSYQQQHAQPLRSPIANTSSRQ